MNTLAQIDLSQGEANRPQPSNSPGRYIGIDAGAETIKLVELSGTGETLQISRRRILEHGKNPGKALVEALRAWEWDGASAAAITGRFAGQVRLRQIPSKQALISGYKFLFGSTPATVINIGSHGFSVLELHANGLAVFRENGRCSQGTGNFLRQLVERFSLTVQEASTLCAHVANPASLSGRCPVILKTDMTHLANKGEDRARILAGLFDAVCENVLALIKPGVSPARVLLTGGVSRSERVRRVFRARVAAVGMEVVEAAEEELLTLEALGAAMEARQAEGEMPLLQELILPCRPLRLETLLPLKDSLPRVRRMSRQALPVSIHKSRRVVIGLDIGSTGAKAVAIDAFRRETLWEAYRQTLGNPVGAAQQLINAFTAEVAGECPVIAFGATGSGREVVGSLLVSCYGKDPVFIVNEIVAHATGALHFDPRVDTIFEIGGQDAKYIRLAESRIIDCAMNEACSAGTGSFIEEQGRKFSSIENVSELGIIAMEAAQGVSLGQHCSVFMAEVIDEAVASGIESPAIISGLYDSIIKNYLNRVKGNRSVGRVIFCQGMPFAADALAAAVARQTGGEIIVPPNPGTVGALGIALLAARELKTCTAQSGARLDLSKFLEARVEAKDSFHCRATVGCGGAGNKCRIERLKTVVQEHRSVFTWGGGCALHDKATRKRKLPDLAPDPFREREALLKQITAPLLERTGSPVIALTDEFMLKGLFPFFAAFFHHAGFDMQWVHGADQGTLKRGIQAADVPYCAPMQLFHGLAQCLVEAKADWVFIPMLSSVPLAENHRKSVVCPIVQAAPDLMRNHLAQTPNGSSILSPRIQFSEGNFKSDAFLKTCESLAQTLNLRQEIWREAWSRGVAAQTEFERGCTEIVQHALGFCSDHNIVPVVVLGRNYTIYNETLNSNVPAILREQGAIAIPVEHYQVGADVPVFNDMYWGYGQAILRAAHKIRRTPGTYAVYCSNYSCGPDSFNLHFAASIMEGKPFAILETDGHSGDAGTKTRLEAFLHCVEEDRHRAATSTATLNDFSQAQFSGLKLRHIPKQNRTGERMLVPYIGPASQAVAAVFRGIGFGAECLPEPGAESLRLGRRYTSGKECLPMPLTLGSLLHRLERAAPAERFVYVMPSTDGPCRFGVYNLLNQIVLARLGWRDRVRIWSPKDSGYFDDLPAGTEMLMLAGIVGTDLLRQALFDVRPAERAAGAALAAYNRQLQDLLTTLEAAARSDLRLAPALWQVISERLFGVAPLLGRAGKEFAAIRENRSMPTVELTGEIYVRAVDFSNDHIIQKLEERGLRVRLAPQAEWLAYCGHLRRTYKGRNRYVDHFSNHIQHRIEAIARNAIGPTLNWPTPPRIEEILAAAGPYVNSALEGEAVLTVGASLESWRRRHIDAVVAVGPLECMPTRIAEAQFHRIRENDGLLTLTLSFNGEPISNSILDNFAFEVHARFRKPPTAPAPPEVTTRARVATLARLFNFLPEL